jgi:ABC-type Fe3+/spermidine/putrescine transport system ATPase subunit
MSLKITGLSKKHNNSWLFRDVSFEVQKGEIVGLFGLSGSGKTALIDSVTGSAQIDAGTIEHNGTDVTGLNLNQRKFCFLKSEDHPAWRSLFNSARASSAPSGKHQITTLIEALNGSCSVLLLDNSFCDMDLHLRQSAFEQLKQTVREKELSVVFASHDFEEILLLCDRVAVLAGGAISQTGAPQKVYETPETSGVAAITGRNNLFEARRLSSSKADLPEFQTIAGDHRLFAQKIERGSLGALNQNVTLGIRPEYISMSFGASFPEDNLLKATVTGVQFLGPTTLIRLDANGLQLESMVLRLVGLNVGDECMVGLPPDRIQIFKH